MLRFLTTIKVITTKQRNKFKNNNGEGGDKRAEKAPFPSGAHKQQEPVSLWQHLQTFLLLSQKYLMLMLQCDASAAVLSQRTFVLASSWLPRRRRRRKKKGLEKKNRSPNWLCLTFVMTGIQWEKEREEEWEMGGEEENGGVAEGDRCVKLYVWKK